MISGLFTLLLAFGCAGLFYAVQSKGKYKERAAGLQRDKEAIKKEAQALADMPHTDDDFHRVMHKRIKRKD